MRAIDEETIMTGAARPTRIQHHSRLSYDRMMIHFTELEEKGMIQRTTGRVVSITVKGREFVSHYDSSQADEANRKCRSIGFRYPSHEEELFKN
jgi:predicted transcriptional regulator